MPKRPSFEEAAEHYISQIQERAHQRTNVHSKGEEIDMHATTRIAFADIDIIAADLERLFPSPRLRKKIAEHAVENFRVHAAQTGSVLAPVIRSARIERDLSIDLPPEQAVRRNIEHLQEKFIEGLLEDLERQQPLSSIERKKKRKELRTKTLVDVGLILYRISDDRKRAREIFGRETADVIPTIRAAIEDLFLRSHTVFRALRPARLIETLFPGRTLREEERQPILKNQEELLRKSLLAGQRAELLHQIVDALEP